MQSAKITSIFLAWRDHNEISKTDDDKREYFLVGCHVGSATVATFAGNGLVGSDTQTADRKVVGNASATFPFLGDFRDVSLSL